MPYYPYEQPWSALTIASRGGFQQPSFGEYDWNRQSEPQPFYGDVPQQPQPTYPANPGYGQFPANPGYNQPQGPTYRRPVVPDNPYYGMSPFAEPLPQDSDVWGQYYGPMPGQEAPAPESEQPELKEFQSDPSFKGRVDEMDRWLEDARNI